MRLLNVAGGTLTFTSEGDHPWIVDGDAAKSTNVNVASSTSTVSTTVTAAAGDILQFDFTLLRRRLRATTVWDGLHLFIDGTEVMQSGTALKPGPPMQLSSPQVNTPSPGPTRRTAPLIRKATMQTLTMYTSAHP